jgi:hypothetical protein
MRRNAILLVGLGVPAVIITASLLLFILYLLQNTSPSPSAQVPPPAATAEAQRRIDEIVTATLAAMQARSIAKTAYAQTNAPPLPSPTPSRSPTLTASATQTPVPTLTQTSTPEPTSTPTVIPESVALTGFRSQLETRNNCGPATLAVALSYWLWQGDQTVPQAYLRPNQEVDDKNVMPEELVHYVENYTQFNALTRVGGDLDLLKQLIAAGFPVMVEKGHITSGWIGHYILLSGYDDTRQQFLTQDSLVVSPDHPMAYSYLQDTWWRHFNYRFIIVYPAERETDLIGVLGKFAEAEESVAHAASIALREIEQLKGRELFFAWYNLGASLAGLGRYEEAAHAFDTAFDQIYFTIPQTDRPWRMLWYQNDPYLTYFNVGRYEDVIHHADRTLAGAAVLEESYYWRGRAREALGDLPGAAADYRQAAALNPNSTPALQELARLGLE